MCSHAMARTPVSIRARTVGRPILAEMTSELVQPRSNEVFDAPPPSPNSSTCRVNAFTSDKHDARATKKAATRGAPGSARPPSQQPGQHHPDVGDRTQPAGLDFRALRPARRRIRQRTGSSVTLHREVLRNLGRLQASQLVFSQVRATFHVQTDGPYRPEISLP
jgi:hypothetical protein